MARVGGRSTWFAWLVGLFALAVVAGAVWLALPIFPASVSWVGDTVAGPTDTVDDEQASVAGCRALYPEALWASLSARAGGGPVQDTSPPVTTAAEFVASIEPAVRFTCAWTSAEGQISTTVADVATDAGAIALAALPPAGFVCDTPGDAGAGRTRCVRAFEGGSEQIDIRDGVWISSSLTGWQPERYASRLAEQILPR